MKKYLSILTALALSMGTSLSTSLTINTNVNKIQEDYQRQFTWTTKTAHVAGFETSDKQTSISPDFKEVVDVTVKTYKLSFSSYLGDAWSDGSNAGYQYSTLSTSNYGTVNFGQENKKFLITTTTFTNKDKTASIGGVELFLYLSYTEKGLTYKFENINTAYQSGLFGWAKTYAKYNFSINISIN